MREYEDYRFQEQERERLGISPEAMQQRILFDQGVDATEQYVHMHNLLDRNPTVSIIRTPLKLPGINGRV